MFPLVFCFNPFLCWIKCNHGYTLGKNGLFQCLVSQLGEIFDDGDGKARHILGHQQALHVFRRVDPPFGVGRPAPAESACRAGPVREAGVQQHRSSQPKAIRRVAVGR